MGKKIYLAGFDVFRPDAVDFGHRCRELCARYGMEGLYPLDNAAMEPGDIFAENDAPLRDRLGEVDAEGFAVEDFGFPVNLMLAIPTRLVRGSLEDCLKQIWEDMGRIR